MVIFLDAEESRTIWPGLQNDRLNDGALPGDRVRDDVAVAVVRCNDNGEIPRPTHRTGEGRLSSDPQRPAAPERRLYLPDVQAPVGYLPRSLVAYQSKGRDLGARHTRWTLPGEIRHLNRDDWDSHRATEIAVVSNGSRPSDDGADAFGLAYSLPASERAAAWDHRTCHPSPLHLVVNADLDHPDYRSPSPSTDDESST